MIKKDTVLILGAGASKSYGFPTGAELKKKIIVDLAPNANTTSTLKDVLKQCGYSDEEMLSFWQSFDKSPLESIDLFLESRRKFIEIGKCCIAANLMWCEESSKFQNSDDNWYDILFCKMHILPPTGFILNNISFITYNYDRSLEQFIFESLGATYGLSSNDCSDIISKLNIIHVYGKLAPLDWEKEEGQPYVVNRYRPEQIKQCAGNIIIMPEGSDRSNEFDKAISLINQSRQVYFLGFGYNDINLKRIGIDQMSKRICVGTAYQIGDSKKRDLENRWRISIPNSTYKIRQFLENIAELG